MNNEDPNPLIGPYSKVAQGGFIVDPQEVQQQISSSLTTIKYLDKEDERSFPELYLISKDVIPLSIVDGLSELDYKRVMLTGANLIKNTGIMLKYPNHCINMALMIFHRFYHLKSLKDNDLKVYSLASLFLAVKCTDSIENIKKLVKYFYIALKAINDRDLSGLAYNINAETLHRIKDDMIEAEIHLLHTNGYQMKRYEKFPHKLLLLMVKTLGVDQSLFQKAWNYCNDSFLSSACIHFPSGLIATASLYLAYLTSNFPMPRYPWWLLTEYTNEDVHNAAEMIYNIYEVENATVRGAKRALERAFRKGDKHYRFLASFDQQYRRDKIPSKGDDHQPSKSRNKESRYRAEKRRSSRERKHRRERDHSPRRHKHNRHGKRYRSRSRSQDSRAKNAKKIRRNRDRSRSQSSIPKKQKKIEKDKKSKKKNSIGSNLSDIEKLLDENSSYSD